MSSLPVSINALAEKTSSLSVSREPMSSIENLFYRLPLELRQDVYRLLLVESNSVEFRLVVDPAGPISILNKLREWDKDISEEAGIFLSRFVFVFMSNREPRRPLYAAVRQGLPVAIRQHITKVFIPNFTLQDMRRPDGEEDAPSRTDRISTSSGILLLCSTCPSMKRLDLELDVVECLGLYLSDTPMRDIRRLRYWRPMHRYQSSRGDGITGIMHYLQSLTTFKGIRDMDIRIYWKTQNPRVGGYFLWLEDMENELESLMEEDVLKELRDRIPAKSIEGYHL